MRPYSDCFPLQPAAREEAGLFYSDDQVDRTLGLDRPVGRVSFANGERMEFTAPQDYLRTIREELPTKDGTGFRFETLTDDPAVRKAVDDMVYDLYGEENPIICIRSPHTRHRSQSACKTNEIFLLAANSLNNT